MQLMPIDTPELIDLAAGWLTDKRNYQWLDFGNGVQSLSPISLKIMSQKDIHVLRAFTSPEGQPIGVVGLTNVDRNFKTATIWIVLGEKQYSLKGCALYAASKMLTVGFKELGLNVALVWTVECNHASARIIKRLNFRQIGRQRQCHYIDGRPYDRLLFDLLASEHKELCNA